MNWKLRVFVLAIGMIWIMSTHLFMGVLSTLYCWDVALEIWSANRFIFRLIFNPAWGFAILMGSAAYFGAEDREKKKK